MKTTRPRPLLTRVLLAGVALLSTAAQAAGPAIGAIGDYHMHLQSQVLGGTLLEWKAREPEVFEMMGEDFTKPRTGADALAALDAAGIREGTLLSCAYMFASPFIRVEPSKIAGLTRAENQFNVDAALASKGRLQAFVSINPLAPGALAELAYWSKRPGVSGIKLHLANGKFDAHAPADIRKLAAVFAFADRNRLPIVIHSRAAKDHGAAEEKLIVEQVLPKATHITVQIAHSGSGWGDPDQIAVDTLNLYADAIERKAKGTEHLMFDLAAIVFDDKGDPKIIAAYVAAMRRIGIERFLPASDWPALHGPKEYYALLRAQIPLTDKEWDIIFSNEAPYFQHPR